MTLRNSYNNETVVSPVLPEQTVMPSIASGSWLFLLFDLPAKQSSDRVKFWRRLRKFATIQLKTLPMCFPTSPFITNGSNGSPRRLQRLFQKAESLGPPRKRPQTKERLLIEDYQGKLWI